MKERPILFNATMVRAIIAGAKTQTRRPITSVMGIGPVAEFQRTNTPGYDWIMRDRKKRWHDLRHEDLLSRCPFGVPGDRLWVREKFATNCLPADENHGARGVTFYAADGSATWPGSYPGKWRPSIHMPRWASRLTLGVVNVRVERVQDITEEDARAEGAVGALDNSVGNNWCAREAFAALWEHIHGPGAWDRNDWVWVVEFKRCDQ